MSIASIPQQREGVGPSRFPVSPANLSQPKSSQTAVSARADQVQVKNPVNPYEGFASEAARVNVDRWKKGPNDSIEHILINQGYSPRDIYGRDSSGKTMIERVAQANGLKDPNLIRPGQKGLLVPVKDKPEAAKPEAPKPEAAKPEAPKPEAPKPEAPKPEAPKPEAPKPEAPKPEAVMPEEVKPEEVKHEEAQPQAEKPKKGRRRFIFFGPHRTRREVKVPDEPVATQEVKPQPEMAQPEVAQPRPEVAQPQTEAVQPQVSNPPAADSELAEKESAEVGLLLDGVRAEKFTRNEFQALNTTANQYTELRAQYARDGFKPEQVRELAQVQQQYGQMYARFLADDKAKITFAGGTSDDPTARFRAQQNEEGGQYYDQFVAHQIDEATLKARLLAQRHNASDLGVTPQQ